MRTSKNFIEVTGGINGKKFLVNKSAIIFVAPEDGTDNAVIYTVNGDGMYRIAAKENYKDVANNLLSWPFCAKEEEDG